MGNLYLIPNTLGEDNFSLILPDEVKSVIKSLDYFIVENERTARAYIKRLLPDKIQKDIHVEIIDKHTDPLDLPGFLKPIENVDHLDPAYPTRLFLLRHRFVSA